MKNLSMDFVFDTCLHTTDMRRWIFSGSGPECEPASDLNLDQDLGLTLDLNLDLDLDLDLEQDLELDLDLHLDVDLSWM